jgi:importin-9
MDIATVDTWDWPQQWPQLTTQLVGAIRERRSEDSVVGALRCLAMILGDMDEAQVPEILPALLPELAAIVAADSAVYTLALKRRALAVLHACLLTLGVMSGAKQRAVRDLMTPLLQPWLDLFTSALAAPPAPSDPGQCGLQLETLRCLTQVVQYFSKSAGEALLTPLASAARLFHSIAPVYHASMIGTDADDYEPPRDDEGETLSLDSVVSQLLELIMCIVEHPRLRSLLVDGTEDTIHRAIGYMCMTAAQEEAWEVRYILLLVIWQMY